MKSRQFKKKITDGLFHTGRVSRAFYSPGAHVKGIVHPKMKSQSSFTLKVWQTVVGHH